MNVLSLSYGKDSLACLGACEQLGIKIDRIIHVEVWATDKIPADLPPMVEFKKKADKIIKERYGIEVEHICALKNARVGGGKRTYESIFYQTLEKGRYAGSIYGFPATLGAWCRKLKMETSGVDVRRYISSGERDAEPQIFQILGIAADEPERIERHSKRDDVILPLVEIGWTEAMCREWCEQNDLLSPIYTTATRGGCWFCHNQGVDQLRLLRRDYPELWALLLKWDKDSPVTFKPDGHTVHDFDRRFQAEDDGLIIPGDRKFRWSQIDGEVQIKFF